jgi:hypothetical protein
VTLPTSLLRWSPEAIEELAERAAIVWASDRNATEADWGAAKAAAEKMVRTRHQKESPGAGTHRRRDPGR